MKKNISIGILLLFLVSILLEVPGVILSYWDKIHQGSPEKTSFQSTTKNGEPIVGEPVEILNLSQIKSWNLSKDQYQREIYINNGVEQPVFYNGYEISSALLSPSHRKLGFFFRPEDHSSGEVVLAVLDTNQKVVKEIYRGDNWTSNWEWKGDEAVIIKRSCGTGCMNASVINVSTGEKIEQYRVY